MRIIREWVKNKYVYYAQLVLEGVPPKKYNSEGIKQNNGDEKRVGIDIGTSTVAVCSEDQVILTELAPNVVEISKKIRNTQRAMDRSKRATNPLKYNKDGTVNISNREKWVFSNRYMKKKNELKELHRLNREKRKQDHETLSNQILSLGNIVFVETMSFKGLQRRAKETTVNKKGKTNSKKRFGRTISKRAPSMLLNIINRKLKYINKSLNKVNSSMIKASQYNHITDTYEKKHLNQRWNDFGYCQIQRDLYSAFLLMNCKESLEEIDRNVCEQNFEHFRMLHDLEIRRLQMEEKTPLSMGL